MSSNLISSTMGVWSNQAMMSPCQPQGQNGDDASSNPATPAIQIIGDYRYFRGKSPRVGRKDDCLWSRRTQFNSVGGYHLIALGSVGKMLGSEPRERSSILRSATARLMLMVSISAFQADRQRSSRWSRTNSSWCNGLTWETVTLLIPVQFRARRPSGGSQLVRHATDNRAYVGSNPTPPTTNDTKSYRYAPIA